jgi:hypothetical protein
MFFSPSLQTICIFNRRVFVFVCWCCSCLRAPLFGQTNCYKTSSIMESVENHITEKAEIRYFEIQSNESRHFSLPNI